MLESLKPMDVVEIIAPGSGKTKEQLELSKEFLKTWDLTTRVSTDLFGPDLLHSNSHANRFIALREALYAPDSKAVWCLCGGTGSAWLVPELEKLTPPSRSKLFIGFSAITCLHIFLNQKWGWTTLHGPSLLELAENKLSSESVQAIKDIIFGQKRSLTFENLIPLNSSAKQVTDIQSTIVGGNLSLIQSGIGTNWNLNTNGKIFFCEDTNEKAFRIAERLEHLKQAGIFRRCKAIIFGHFTFDQENAAESKLCSQVLRRFAEETSIPEIGRAHV